MALPVPDTLKFLIEPFAAVGKPPTERKDRDGGGQGPPKREDQVGGQSDPRKGHPENLALHDNSLT